MLDKVKQVPRQFLTFWNKYNSKQKTTILSVTAVIVISVAFLVWLFTKTNFETLATFEQYADTAEAKELLEAAGIECQVPANGLVILVDEDKIADARLVLGQNGIASEDDDYWSSVFDNGLSTTESEKVLKAKLAKQKEMAAICKKIDGVKNATVTLNLPDNSNSIFKTEEQAYVSAMLTTTKDLPEDAVDGIATYLATSVGLDSTNNVRIIDQTGKLLFAGKDNTNGGANTNNVSAKEQITIAQEQKIRSLLLSSGEFQEGSVVANLDISFDEVQSVDTHYYVDEGNKGPVDEEYISESEGASGTGDVVGTDANDDQVTEYNITNAGTTGGSATIEKRTYSTSSTVTEKKEEVGKVDLENSSVSIILTQYEVFNEEDLEAAGELEDKTFEEFQMEHSAREEIEVDEQLYEVVANASGISTENIRILAYKVPVFYPKEATTKTVTDYLPFILVVIIIVLLLVVVIRGMKPVEVTELEPELSVESLLATTKENQQLEEIEFNDKSSAREQIEKFVDENPEAVASLLRNWLNEEWE
ncbi:MAG: hypothetical protein IJA10_07305 [Lachnospiraceae bacterium]|nr:hypothetical protein [Lachnospiraceae bacterium]